MPIRTAVLDLPSHLAVGVASIILHWSFQVWLLQQITYALLNVDMKRGRVAVRDPRPEDYVPMIEELMDLCGYKTSLDLAGLREDLRQLKTLRDAIAHGVWMQGEKNIIIQFVSGTWTPPVAGAKPKKMSRRVIPEGRPVTGESLQTIRAVMQDTIRVTQKLLSEVEQQAFALHGRSPQQPGAASPSTDPN